MRFGLDVPTLAALDATERALGVRAAIVGGFRDWAGEPAFPRAFAEAVHARGAVPMISWEPWDAERGGADQPDFALARIAAGAHDALIDAWAEEAAAFGRPLLLRFAAEMNGDWLPWSTGVNGNAIGDHAAAWRHVRARFARAGARHVAWVWNPIAAYDGATPLEDLFPGEDAVDWLAVDGYNWGDVRRWGWQSYDDVLAPTVEALARLAPHRPRMIAEIGCAPGPRKGEWVADAFRAARAGGVEALVWFEFDKETDWRLASDPAAVAAVRAAVAGG